MDMARLVLKEKNMTYLTNYYKNKCSELNQKINKYENDLKILNESQQINEWVGLLNFLQRVGPMAGNAATQIGRTWRTWLPPIAFEELLGRTLDWSGEIQGVPGHGGGLQPAPPGTGPSLPGAPVLPGRPKQPPIEIADDEISDEDTETETEQDLEEQLTGKHVNYLTNYYKNKCEELKYSINKPNNQKKLFEASAPVLTRPASTSATSETSTNSNNTGPTINPGNYSWWRYISRLFAKNWNSGDWVRHSVGNIPEFGHWGDDVGQVIIKPFSRAPLHNFGKPPQYWLFLRYAKNHKGTPHHTIHGMKLRMFAQYNRDRVAQGLNPISWDDFWNPVHWDVPKVYGPDDVRGFY